MQEKSRMSLWHSILFFGVPGLLMFVGVFYVEPVLSQKGLPSIVIWPLLIWWPIVALFFGILILFFRQAERQSFYQRFRFHRLSKKELGITIGAFLGVQLGELVLSPTGRWLSQFRLFSVPQGIPDLFNPHLELEHGLTQLFGVPLQGHWWLLVFWAGWLIVNIGCEEILWRGYALPLQERYFGKYAWLVNGLCWNLLIHWFLRWNCIALLPISLIVPYLVQKYKNTWIGVIIHGTGNLLVYVLLIPGIMTK